MGAKRRAAEGEPAPEPKRRAKKAAGEPEPKAEDTFDMSPFIQGTEDISYDLLKVDSEKKHGQVCFLSPCLAYAVLLLNLYGVAWISTAFFSVEKCSL